MVNAKRFAGLDGIRGLAAMGVLLGHTEQARLFFDLPSYYMGVSARRIDQLSVSVFFVLSGFLITYLLEVERSRSKTIDVSSFYMRRVLRIWPLYYLLALVSFFVIPHISLLKLPVLPSEISSFPEKLALYLGLSPHVAQTFYPEGPVPYGAVLWSVGVEEWFYLLWPWALMLTRRRWVVFAVMLFGPAICRLLATGGAPFYFFSQIRYDCMALGALGALCFVYREMPAVALAYNALTNRRMWLASLIILGVLTAIGVRFGAADDLIYGVLFLVLIVGAAGAGYGSRFLNSRPLLFLGAVSYGSYCFNWIGAVLSLRLTQSFGITSAPVEHTVHVITSITLTLGAAAISRIYFERPFLRLKDKAFGERRQQPSST